MIAMQVRLFLSTTI